MSASALYQRRRAAGLCGECGSPSPASARCGGCQNRLADRRRGGGPEIGSRLDHLDERALSVIGRRLGLTKERVRQIQDRALDRLHKHLRAQPGGDAITRDDVMHALAALAIMSGETQPPVTAADRSTRGGKRSGYWRGKLAATTPNEPVSIQRPDLSADAPPDPGINLSEMGANHE